MHASRIWILGFLVGMATAEAVAQECVGQPNGTPCTSDGIDCTDDVCIAQVCEHPQSMDGTPCIDEGHDCTIDVCVSGACTHNPRPAGFPCGDPSNTDCTNPDLCDDSGNCQSANAPDGAPCDDGLYCTRNDACFDGACVGGGPECLPGDICDEGSDVCTECTTDSECNDHNPCTVDVCTSNQCAYDPFTGAPCGGSVDDDCTNPDACDMFGVCRPNNEPDDTPCDGGTGQCRAGVCRPPAFTSAAAPEDIYVASRLTDCFEPTLPYPGGGFTGQVMDNGGIWHAAYWEPGPSGPLLRVLDTSMVDSNVTWLGCDPNIDYFCLGVGEKDGAPVAWSVWKGGDPYGVPTVEDPGLPPGGGGGIMMDGEYQFAPTPPNGRGDKPDFIGTGFIYDERDLLHGVVWHRSAAGMWTNMRLPELGPNTQSRALGVIDLGQFAGIGGSAETPQGHMVPAVWQEMTPGMLDFDEPILLPLLPGIVSGEVNALVGQQGEELVAGTVVTAAGNKVGAVWACGAGYTGCGMLILPPLPGSGNALVTGIDDFDFPIYFPITGMSYDIDGMTDGRATLWRVSRDPLGLISTTDFLDLAFPDSTAQDRLITAVGNLASCLEGRGPCEVAGVLVQDPGPNQRQGTPTPHVVLLDGQPQEAIPTTSEWGLVALMLLVLTAATVALRRRPEAYAVGG